jgi:hypothetical protein
MNAERWALGAQLFTQDRGALLKLISIGKLTIQHCVSYGLDDNVDVGTGFVELRGE